MTRSVALKSSAKLTETLTAESNEIIINEPRSPSRWRQIFRIRSC